MINVSIMTCHFSGWQESSKVMGSSAWRDGSWGDCGRRPVMVLTWHAAEHHSRHKSSVTDGWQQCIADNQQRWHVWEACGHGLYAEQHVTICRRITTDYSSWFVSTLTVGRHLLSLVRRSSTLCQMIYEIPRSAQQPLDSCWRHIFSLPISTFSALGMSHIMR